jgi:PilZ domain
MSEKRDNERMHVPGPVTGEVTVYQPMTVLDISARGALIETTFPLQLEALHDFRLSLGSRSVVVKGRIVHCQIGELHEGAVVYRTGIEFIEPPPHAQLAIDAFVEAQRSVDRASSIVDAEIAEDGV